MCSENSLEYLSDNLDEMRILQDTTLIAQKIKEMLIAIKTPDDDFKVVINNTTTPEMSGCYALWYSRITLYLLNCKTKNEFISVAIHEYAHHFIRGGEGGGGTHRTEFWLFNFELLEIAEKLGYYKCDINKSEELTKITDIINKNNMIKNNKMVKKELTWVWYEIDNLCEKFDIEFRHYTVKYLKMDWYKKKNPLLSYNQFYRNNILWRRREKNFNSLQEFINNFL
ncbi:hypothetical protein AGMMS49960_20460 [Betaproteobacteria bacterium]|nr:hypothetical protein AGMMS49960_20460 [Betaproteobacteria bacterium]